jgi:hypothetical protein
MLGKKRLQLNWSQYISVCGGKLRNTTKHLRKTCSSFKISLQDLLKKEVGVVQFGTYCSKKWEWYNSGLTEARSGSGNQLNPSSNRVNRSGMVGLFMTFGHGSTSNVPGAE